MPKHVIANGGRDSHPMPINERLLHQIYWPPFRACFQKLALSRASLVHQRTIPI